MPFVGSRMGCSMKHVEMMAPVKNGSHPTGSVCYQYMSWLTRLIVVECGVCTRSGYAMQEGISTAKPAVVPIMGQGMAGFIADQEAVLLDGKHSDIGHVGKTPFQ